MIMIGEIHRLVFLTYTGGSTNAIGEVSGATPVYTSYTAQFNQVGSPTRVSQMVKGLDATVIYRARIDGDERINLNDVFYADGLDGAFKVNSEAIKHFQLGTDFVDYTEFTAVKTANTPTAATIETYL